jgi:ribonuclease E
MPKRMLINARHAEESRVAILADERLIDFATETATKNQNKGNIYKGVVSKIERSLGAAFVDYGEERHGFLPFSEVNLDFLCEPGNRREGARAEDLLLPRSEVLVQVVKEEVGSKGAALSTYVSLPGRYLVLMPGTDTGGVSRKIEDEEQRKRLKETIAQLRPPPNFGIIVRTAGLDRTKAELQKDLQYLLRVWKEVEERYVELPGPGLVHREPELAIRILRDYLSPDVEEVLIDNKEIYQRAVDFFATFMPRSQIALKLYQGTRPLFSLYNVEEQVSTIYLRKVTLNGGGTILIDPTEALVAIDVNSGKATQERGREETAYRVNLEAAEEVARQIRLRDLGGLIVIDFIDMRDRKHMRDVERCFRNALKDDKARVKIGKLSSFGLLEMSRQRLRPDSLDRSYRTCPTCGGSRLVPTAENQAITVLRQMQEGAAQGDLVEVRGAMLQDGLLYLLNQKREEVLRLEKDYNVRVSIGVASGPEECRLEFIRRGGRVTVVDRNAERQGTRPRPQEPRRHESRPQPRPLVPPRPAPASEACAAAQAGSAEAMDAPAPDVVGGLPDEPAGAPPETPEADLQKGSAGESEGKERPEAEGRPGPADAAETGSDQPPREGEKRRRRRRRRGRRRKHPNLVQPGTGAPGADGAAPASPSAPPGEASTLAEEAPAERPSEGGSPPDRESAPPKEASRPAPDATPAVAAVSLSPGDASPRSPERESGRVERHRRGPGRRRDLRRGREQARPEAPQEPPREPLASSPPAEPPGTGEAKVEAAAMPPSAAALEAPPAEVPQAPGPPPPGDPPQSK